MSNSHENGRNEEPTQRGNPARGSRNQRRAYNLKQSKTLELASGGKWEDAKQFEERPQKPRGRTNRSQAWKVKREEAKKPAAVPQKDDSSTSYDFRAKEETSPVDEPLYDLGPHTSSIPVQELYSQNCDFSGLIVQIERTYETLRGIDPRIDKRMPFSMFQHATRECICESFKYIFVINEMTLYFGINKYFVYFDLKYLVFSSTISGSKTEWLWISGRLWWLLKFWLF